MLRIIRVWVVVNILIELEPTISQNINIPQIACPNYFQYLLYNNNYIGRITLPNVSKGSTKLEASFTQRAPVQSNYGKLSLYDDQQTTLNNIENGLPVSYRVDFPLVNVVPKLTGIRVNGVDICVASDYPPPSTTLNLEHSLHTTTTVLGNTLPLPNGLNFDIIGGAKPQSVPTHQNPAVQTNFNFVSRPKTPLSSTRVIHSTQPATQFNDAFAISNTIGAFAEWSSPESTWIQDYALPQATTIQYRPRIGTNTVQYSPMITQRRPPVVTNAIQYAPTNNQQYSPTAMNTLNSVCGFEHKSVTPFIYGGTYLSRGQFPWLTAIYEKKLTGPSFTCAGSLISARTIITAAHCFRLTSLTADKIVAYLGRHNLLSDTEKGVVTRDIQKLIINDQYNEDSFPDADLAILQMVSPVTFDQFIRPICLWNEPDDSSLIIGQIAKIGGWGADETGRSVSPIPKMVNTTIKRGLDCVVSLEVYRHLVTERTICAGNRDGTGPCKGDSGSGLVLNRNGRWMLRGVVSAGQANADICNLGEFVLYCDIAKHMSWVRTYMLV